MSKRQLLCLLGAWTIVFLFLGLPSGWHKIIAIVTGLLVIIVAYNLPAAQSSVDTTPRETFVENKKI
jgi:hypothetical protein